MMYEEVYYKGRDNRITAIYYIVCWVFGGAGKGKPLDESIQYEMRIISNYAISKDYFCRR